MEQVEQILKIRSKYRVTLSDGSQWWLTAKEMKKLNVREGSLFEPASLREQLLPGQVSRGTRLAVAMLAQRPCSQGEIRKKMIVNHYPEEAAERVIQKLAAAGLLDDRAFAEQWVRYRLTCRYGTRRIAQELKIKGIDSRIREEALEALQEEELTEQAASLIRSKIRRNPAAAGDWQEKRKIMNTLIRRGFTWEIANRAWNQEIAADPTEE